MRLQYHIFIYLNEFICSMMSKWFQNSGRSEWSDRSQLCIFAISCYLCQLTLWVGPLKKQHAPTNKMLGSDLILFWDLPDFFFKGVLPPHSLEVHHTRMILLVNCRELCNSCNQQLQPTAWQLRPISRHIASMKDQDGSGTSAYTGCKKKKNVVIYRLSPLEQCHYERPS